MINLKTLRLSFISSLLFVASTANARPALEQLWLTEGLSVPESTLVYRNGKLNLLFVSQIDGDPSAMDGQGGIAKMTLNGEIDDLNWVTGLNAPKGMAAFDGKLYVADINQLVIINIKSGEIEKRIIIPGAQFLNDVAIDLKGAVYISDTKTNKVHRYEKDLLDDYAVKAESANGLKVIGSNLVVGAGTHLFLIDKNKNRLQIASGFAQGIDGIESIGKGDFLVSCWPGLLYYVHLDGKLDLLLDSQKEGINTADIGFDHLTQTVFVPNFAKNSVTAYKVITN
ncbi:MAG: GTP-binding protein [Moraxellaceae bacterium]|nr:MAG: GTP-binding protein [Moraxellaceae bacterium]